MMNTVRVLSWPNLRHFTVAGLALLCFTGCTQLGTVVESYRANFVEVHLVHFSECANVKPGTADSHWALLHWYLNDYGGRISAEEREAAERGMTAAEQQIFSNWAGKLANRHRALSFAGGRLNVNTANVPARELSAALSDLDATIALSPSMTTCWDFPWMSNLSKNDSFPRWFRTNQGNLVLQGHRIDSMRSELRAQIQQSLKGEVDDRLAAAQHHLDAGDKDQAFSALRQALEDFPWSERLQQMMGKLAKPMVATEVAAVREKLVRLDFSGPNAEANVLEAERQFAQLHARWLAAPGIRAALAPASATQLDELRTYVAEARGRLWSEELTAAATARTYWRLQDIMRRRLAELDAFDEGRRAIINRALWSEYNALLPAAFAYYLSAGQRHTTGTQFHGITLAIHAVMDGMLEFAREHDQSPSPEATRLLQSAAATERQAKEYCRSEVLSRRVVVDSFSPPTPGVAVSRELQGKLSKLVHDSRVAADIGVESAGETRPRDYHVTDGRVVLGQLRSEELSRQRTEYRERGGIEERDNPDYVQRKQAGQDTASLPARIQVQQVIIHQIVTATTRYSAEGTASFRIVHQKQESPAEVTARISVDCVQEELDAGAQKIVWEQNPRPRRALRALRHDPSPNRASIQADLQRIVSDAAAVRLVNSAARYPLELAAVARRFQQLQQWELATNYWGYCLAALADLDTSGQYAATKLSGQDLASAIRQEYESQQLLCGELHQLEAAAARESREALVHLVQSRP